MKNNSTLSRIRELRKIQCERFYKHRKNVYEEIFKKALRIYGRTHGLQYDKQFIVCPYIVDFYFPSKGVGLEIDEPHHEKKQEYDAMREQYIMSFGITIVRYKIGSELKQPYDFIDDLFKTYPDIGKKRRKSIRKKIRIANRFYGHVEEDRRFGSFNDLYKAGYDYVLRGRKYEPTIHYHTQYAKYVYPRWYEYYREFRQKEREILIKRKKLVAEGLCC